MLTCTATPVPGLPAAILWWAKHINREDVIPAYRKLNEIISASPVPVYIFVDLRERPDFPLTDTLRGALEGPFRNANLAEWLVIGSTPLAQTIARTLSAITLRHNIRWFKDEEDARAYLIGVLNKQK